MPWEHMLDDKLGAVDDRVMVLIIFGVIFGFLLEYKNRFWAFFFGQVDITIDEPMISQKITLVQTSTAYRGCKDITLARILMAVYFPFEN